MLAGLGAGQESCLRQAAYGLRVHLQEVGRFLEVQGVHLAGSYSSVVVVCLRGSATEIGRRDLFAFVVYPGVEFKAVEGNALPANRDLGQQRTDLSAEAVAVHAEVAGASRKWISRGGREALPS